MFSSVEKNTGFRERDGIRSLLVPCVGAWLVAAAAALLATGSTRMNAPEGAIILSRQLALGAAAVIIPSLCLCRLALRKVWTRQLGYVLAALAAVVCVGVAVNVGGWCPAFDPSTPDLGPYTDPTREWETATSLQQGALPDSIFNRGYPMLLCLLWRVFGHSVLPPAFFSAFCTVLAGGTVAATAVRLLPQLNAAKTATCAALLFALVPSVAWYGALCMKEAPVILAMALCTYTLATAWRGPLTPGAFASIATGGGMLLVLKSPLGWWLLLGACASAAHTLRDRRAGREFPGSAAGALCVMLVAAAVVAGGRSFRAHPDDTLFRSQARDLPRYASLDSTMLGYSTVRPYAGIIGSYYSATPGEKLAKLPLAAAAQYFPPFPWNFTRDTAIGRFVPWAHLPLWYLTGGCVLGFVILCLFRRRRAASLGLWCAWAAVCWCGTAYASAGSVARYWLPLLPALIPCAVMFLACARRRLISARDLKIYSSSYVVLLAAGLTAAYIFLHS